MLGGVPALEPRLGVRTWWNALASVAAPALAVALLA